MDVVSRGAFARVVVSSLLLAGLAATDAAAEARSDPGAYPSTVCVVSGTALGESPVVLDHDGREVRFCGQACAAKFSSDVVGYLSGLDAAIVASQSEIYPLDTCVVTGEPLGREGPPFDLVHANRLVKLCCGGCRKGFEKDAVAHVAALDEAVVAQQAGSYPLTTCVVSGKPLGEMGEPFDYVVAGRLVRLCCGGCVEELLKNPVAALTALGASSPVSSEAE